jgi:hypothetical protein
MVRLICGVVGRRARRADAGSCGESATFPREPRLISHGDVVAEQREITTENTRDNTSTIPSMSLFIAHP